jgi:hypothetical protein
MEQCARLTGGHVRILSACLHLFALTCAPAPRSSQDLSCPKAASASGHTVTGDRYGVGTGAGGAEASLPSERAAVI